jgi:2-polyprenyl-6-methoxyphenol hydroxylase-like FAD-dependent oxidoreductase
MMGAKRHVEIAGGGLAGLTAACVLAQRGWSVRVHERQDSLREFGAGLYLRYNSLKVLKEVGVLERILSRSNRLREFRTINYRNTVILKRVIAPEELAITLLRSDLHRALADRAMQLGVDVETSSQVVGADPDGTLKLASGRILKADLVLGADGYRSAVRESVGLTARVQTLGEGATRVLVHRKPGEREGVAEEHWSGDARLGCVASSPEHLYLFLMGLNRNLRVGALPIDKAFWKERVPQLAHIVDRISTDAGRHDGLVMVYVHGWSVGKVAILGDAAHAQPPNFGQGAGLAIANAGWLGTELERAPDVPGALQNWERNRRAVSEEVQRWSHRHGLIYYYIPWETARAGVLKMIGKTRFSARKWAWLTRGGHHANEIRDSLI